MGKTAAIGVAVLILVGMVAVIGLYTVFESETPDFRIGKAYEIPPIVLETTKSTQMQMTEDFKMDTSESN